MRNEEDKRPTILLSDLWEKAREAYFKNKTNRHDQKRWKVDVVIIALAVLNKYAQPKEILEKIAEYKADFGKYPYDGLTRILEPLREENLIDHKEPKGGYRLNFRVLPRPDRPDNQEIDLIMQYKSHKDTYISDLITRIKRLRGITLCINEPSIGVTIIGLLTDLLIFLDKTGDEEIANIEKARGKIHEYQVILSGYINGHRDRDENLVFNQMIEALEKLESLSIKKTMPEEEEIRLDEDGESEGCASA